MKKLSDKEVYMDKCNLGKVRNQEVDEKRLEILIDRYTPKEIVVWNSYRKGEVSAYERKNWKWFAYKQAVNEMKSRERSGGEEREARLGLSNTIQVRPKSQKCFVSYNRATRQVKVSDPNKVKYLRMKAKFGAYIETMRQVDECMGALTRKMLTNQLITLTYDRNGKTTGGKPQVLKSRDISRFVDSLRKYLERKIIPMLNEKREKKINDPWRYIGLAWAFEGGKNGNNFHYHVAITTPKEWGFQDLPKKYWKVDELGLWKKGMSRYGMRGGETELKTLGYLCKYMTKEDTARLSDEAKGFRLFHLKLPKDIWEPLAPGVGACVKSYYKYLGLPKEIQFKYTNHMMGIEAPFVRFRNLYPLAHFKREIEVWRVLGGVIIDGVYYEGESVAMGVSTPLTYPPSVKDAGIGQGSGNPTQEQEWLKEQNEVMKKVFSVE